MSRSTGPVHAPSDLRFRETLLAVLPPQVHEELRLAALVPASALITSARDAWRLLCARWIHAASRCAPGPFVAVGPQSAHPGGVRRKFERAWGGTLYIEDITRFDAATQQSILSLLESRPAANGAPNRVRVIAGASRHLTSDRASGRFSDELFYRLNVIHINLVVADTTHSADA
jgi:DNA-binding NtrC family response regulator